MSGSKPRSIFAHGSVNRRVNAAASTRSRGEWNQRRAPSRFIGAGEDDAEYMDPEPSERLDPDEFYESGTQGGGGDYPGAADAALSAAEIGTGWKFVFALTLLVFTAAAAVLIWNVWFAHHTSDNINDRVDGVAANVTLLDADIADVNATLLANITELDARLTIVEGNITTLNNTDATHTSQIAALDTRVSTLESDVAGVQSNVTSAQDDIVALQAKDMVLMTNASDQQAQIDLLLASGLQLVNGTLDLNETLLQLLDDVQTNQIDIAQLQVDVAGKVDSVTGGTSITISGTANDPVVNWAAAIGDLSNVDTTGVVAGDRLEWSGSAWLPTVAPPSPNIITFEATYTHLANGGAAGSLVQVSSGWVVASSPTLGTDAVLGGGGVPTIQTTGVYAVTTAVHLDGPPAGPFGFQASVCLTGTTAGTCSTATAATDTMSFVTQYAKDPPNVLYGHDIVSYTSADTLRAELTAGYTGSVLAGSYVRITLQRIG